MMRVMMMTMMMMGFAHHHRGTQGPQGGPTNPERPSHALEPIFEKSTFSKFAELWSYFARGRNSVHNAPVIIKSYWDFISFVTLML